MDDLSRERIEVDVIKLSGPAFPGVDNRLLSLQLVEQGVTDAAMFTASGEVTDEKYYPELPGGVLESAGRLFKRSVKV